MLARAHGLEPSSGGNFPEPEMSSSALLCALPGRLGSASASVCLSISARVVVVVCTCVRAKVFCCYGFGLRVSAVLGWMCFRVLTRATFMGET